LTSSINTALISESKDFEYNGQINRNAGQGATFQLMMAMLEQDVLARSKIEKKAIQTDSKDSSLDNLNHYPAIPLSTNEREWVLLGQSKQITDSNPNDGKLWQAMHPHPLSIYNDVKRIPDDILYNCDLYTQRRVRSIASEAFAIDETGLLDILEKVAPQSPV
jgi:hypothetical protein